MLASRADVGCGLMCGYLWKLGKDRPAVRERKEGPVIWSEMCWKQRDQVATAKQGMHQGGNDCVRTEVGTVGL
jgi:hypothetical protein